MSRGIQWRFSVRGLLGVIAVVSAFLAISRWQTPFHASCLYVAGSLVLLCIVGCLRRKRWVYVAVACLGASIVALLLCWFGPASLEESVWGYLCSWEQYWGGGQMNGDSFGWYLGPLKRLRDTSAQMDRTTFVNLARKYRIVCEEAADEDFLRRCQELLPVGKATDSGQ
jgi:hypothetical protein